MTYYLSVDIETTGLDPETCQTIEIAAALDSATEPLLKPLMFHCYIDHGLFQGEAYALSMHSKIFRAIATKTAPCPVFNEFEVMAEFAKFLEVVPQKDRITVAGKNFGSFDRLFLGKLPDAKLVLKRFRHRYIDTGALYWEPTTDGFVLPDSNECLKRAGITDHDTEHTAISDSLDTCDLIRKHPRTAALWTQN